MRSKPKICLVDVDLQVKKCWELSLNTEADFNLHALRNITFEAGANIAMKASGSYLGINGKTDVGRIQLESKNNTNVLVGGTTHITTSGNLELNTQGANAFTAGSTTDILSGGNHTETAPEIHMNGPQAATAATASALSTHGLPGHYINEVLVQRSPQSEPWNHHENLNPDAFKIIKTDRDNIVTVSNDIIVEPTPDPFRKESTST